MAVQENMPFWKRLLVYLKAPENVILLKISIFCFYGGAICVFPFFVLQMRLIGFTISEIALIYLVVPVASLLGPVISGMTADKWGKYNIVLAINMTLTIFFFDMLLTVPAVPLPPGTISCPNNSSDCLFIVDNCKTCMSNTNASEVTFTLKQCKYIENETKNELQMEQETYNIHNKIILSTNYTGNCTFRVLGVQPVDNSSSIFREIPSKDMVCGIECNSACDEDMKRLYSYSFWVFLIYKFLGNLFGAAAFTMTDASIIAMSKKYNLSVARQKIMTMFAFAIMPIFSGIIIDYHSSIVGYNSYFGAFMLATALMVVSIAIMVFLKIEAEKGTGNMMKDIKKLITLKEVLLFLVVLLILGTNFGFIESYIFIYLKSLGASGFLLGFTLTVGCTFSIPMLFYADKFEEKIGRRNIYTLCFTCYAIRMLGYSYIWNPWMGLIFEVFEALTYQLMWVTSLKVFPLLAPKGLLATMTGIAGAVHYSFGKGIGGFLGGQIIEMVGMRMAFRIMSFIALGGGTFYYVIDKFVLEEKLAERERQQKEEEMQNKMAEISAKEPAATGNHCLPHENYAKQSLLAVPYEYPINPSDQVNKKGDYQSKDFSKQANTIFARSMPHLYLPDELEATNRASIIGWISSDRLYL